jgi:hypothetical protein
VGYIPREQAKRFKDQAEQAGLSGENVLVSALVAGGWRTNQYDEGAFGVKLAMPTRGEIIFDPLIA